MSKATTERMSDDDLTQRVARALFDGAAYGPTRFALEKPWEQISPLIQAGWRTTAAAAIAAMPSHTEVIEALRDAAEMLGAVAVSMCEHGWSADDSALHEAVRTTNEHINAVIVASDAARQLSQRRFGNEQH